MKAQEIREYVRNYMRLNDMSVSMLARRAQMPITTVHRMVNVGEKSSLQNWERLLDSIGARLIVDEWRYD